MGRIFYLNISAPYPADKYIPSPDDYNSRRGIPALPFYQYQKGLKKPLAKNVPLIPSTIGEHILKKRLELRLLQKDVAQILSVSEDTITYWENNRSKPFIHHYPGIIIFLGYYPFTHKVDSIAGKLRQLRYYNGHSYEQFGKILNVNGTTIMDWEKGKRLPKKSMQHIIIHLWLQLKLTQENLLKTH